jgi:hypothetical protein
LSARLISSVLLLGIALVVPGFADVAIASGAGELPGTAQDLSGDASLSEIQGTLVSPDFISMFKIDILYPGDFSAQTILPFAFGVQDPVLFLFDASGLGVYMNDDQSDDPTTGTQSCLPSSDSGNPCASPSGGLGPLTPGIYYLAITFSQNLPWDSSDTYNFLSSFSSTDVLGPDSTAGAIAGWYIEASVPDFDDAQYDILITDAPEPAAWTLIAVVAAFVLFRRRQWAAQPPR